MFKKIVLRIIGISLIMAPIAAVFWFLTTVFGLKAIAIGTGAIALSGIIIAAGANILYRT